MTNDGGKKDDTGKPEYYLLPSQAMDLFVRVLTHGKYKYGAHNWRLVPDGEDRYFSAAMRHMMKYLGGEWLDPDSRLPHLAHALCSLAFCIELHFEEHANGTPILDITKDFEELQRRLDLEGVGDGSK